MLPPAVSSLSPLRECVKAIARTILLPPVSRIPPPVAAPLKMIKEYPNNRAVSCRQCSQGQ